MVQKTPCVLRIAIHLVVKTTPEIFRGLGSSSCRRCRELAHLRLCHSLGRITASLQLSFVLVHRIRTFGTKELQRVIAKNVGVGQNLVVGQVLLVLVNSKVGVTSDCVTCAISPLDGAVQHPFQI